MSTEGPGALGAELPQVPENLFARLAQIPGYLWDENAEPFHSTYDHWHVFGVRHVTDSDSSRELSRASISHRTSSARSSPKLDPRPAFRHHWSSVSDADSSNISSSKDTDNVWIPVVARVSTHLVRLEREFAYNKMLIQSLDPEGDHTVRPLEMTRLAGAPGETKPILVAIFESPGKNYLRQCFDFGPGFYARDLAPYEPQHSQIPVQTFLDFAIGACETLELLHHGARNVHGELRAESFHFNKDSGKVRIVNVGNGARTFENALSSQNWSLLTSDPGGKNKLQYMAPEQTGRLSVAPDTRTDIYSMGIIFYYMLTGRPAIEGSTALEIVQKVLTGRIPSISTHRMDVPNVISHLVAKMTARAMDERYQSISGVKHDLVNIAQLLGEGDTEGLEGYEIGSKDISSFFMLPSKTFGRTEEMKQVMHVVERASRRLHSTIAKTTATALASISSNSSVTESRMDGMAELDVNSSDSNSISLGAHDSRSTSVNAPALSTAAYDSPTTIPRGPLIERIKSGSHMTESTDQESLPSSNLSSQPDSLNRRRGSLHLRKRMGRCEVVVLDGPQGSGKTHLAHALQSSIRRYSYFTIAKFDRARPSPFEPLIQAIGSILRQIFSEKDVNTPYHDMVRNALSPLWRTLSTLLELPEQLLARSNTTGLGNRPGQASFYKSIKSDLTSVESGSTTSSLSNGHNVKDTKDFLRGPASTRGIRFVNTCIDVLRTLSSGKLLCICLDDLHVADEESLTMISNIIKAKLPLVLILAGRLEDETPEGAKLLMENDSTTVVEVANLTEDDVFTYVAETLHTNKTHTLPLAAVVLEKSSGNPFLMREILQTCYQKNCIWYDWRRSGWEYDLDRVFREFESEQLGCLTTSFITKRLNELPMASKAILAWASLIGTTFSFSLIQQLMSGEFQYSSGDETKNDVTCPTIAAAYAKSENDIVDGLQTLMSFSIIVTGETDDEFAFAHDRYARAASKMSESWNVEKMHFLIAQNLLKYGIMGKLNLHSEAQHICYAKKLIRERVPQRIRYRDVLVQAAQQANETGARPTALAFYRSCLYLLQDDPWREGADRFYDETLQLYIQIAELSFVQGQTSEAMSLLDETFAHARTPACKTRAWILRSRISAANGDGRGSLKALTTSLAELGADKKDLSWEECDTEFKRLQEELDTTDKEELLARPLSQDPTVIALGTVLAEAIASAYWADALMFYRFALRFVDVHLHRGVPVQVGLGYCHLASVALGRFEDIELTASLGQLSLSLLEVYSQSWTKGNGGTVYSLFVGHVLTPLRNLLPLLDNAFEGSYAAGDRTVSLINVGTMSFFRLAAGQDLSEIESFCMYAPEDFEGWESDLRGGVTIIAVRQTVRALQGKTFSAFPHSTLSDGGHDSRQYLEFLHRSSSNPERTRDIYLAVGLQAWYLLGHHRHVVEVGTELLKTLPHLWTPPFGASARFYLALATLSVCRDEPSEEVRTRAVSTVREYRRVLENWTKLCDVNYAMWIMILDAEIASLQGIYGIAARMYEAAIDHSQVHGFAIEEALAVELQAEFLISRGAKRAGKVMIQEAIAAWSRLNAGGKAKHLADKHEWLLKTATTARTMDTGVQTDSSLAEVPVTKGMSTDNRNALTSAWIDPKSDPDASKAVSGKASELPGLGLDILDLSSILEFSQVISSELQVDKLLTSMIGILLESVGGQADFVAIIKDLEDRGWCLAASGSVEHGIKHYADGVPFADVDDQVAQQITHYIMRLRETVFVHNILEDERFSSVSDAYLARNPTGRSVIALPIMQADSLLGIIYVEGAPNSFTERNLTVLKLLTNQVSISLGNALLYRRVRKVSAANASMIESQKKALAAARDAEAKARKAEAEAKENVRLKEEAMRAKSVFLANVSHELRTPLNGVIGMSELLRGTTLSDEQEGYCESIRTCADLLLQVINDILDYSKLDANKMKMFTVPLNLKETISEVVRALAYTNKERELDMIEDLQLTDDLILGDPVRIHQLLFNLLSNAIKFTPRGSVTTAAKVELESETRVKVTISVTDTGIGISEEQLSRLFKPFSQADNSTQRSYGGSGLGLSICKAMVENVLGGKIWIESTPGEGTKVAFTVTFKKAPKDAQGTSTEITAEAPDPMANWSQDAGFDGHVAPAKAAFRDLSKIPRSEIRVCIVEDNPINQKIAISFVKRLGLYCDAFSDGKQAVDALRQKSKENCEYHLVLMDCQMPIMDGYEATRSIREDSDPNVREVIVIAMTASAIRGDREKCLDAGMNNYLAKPVRANVLSSMLDEYLSKSPEEFPNMQDPEDNISQLSGNVKGKADGVSQKGTKARFAADNELTPKTTSVEGTAAAKKSRKPVRRIKRPSFSSIPTAEKHPASKATTRERNIAATDTPASKIATPISGHAPADDVSTNDFAADEKNAKDNHHLHNDGSQADDDPLVTASKGDHPLAKFKKVIENSNESTKSGFGSDK